MTARYGLPAGTIIATCSSIKSSLPVNKVHYTQRRLLVCIIHLNGRPLLDIDVLPLRISSLHYFVPLWFSAFPRFTIWSSVHLVWSLPTPRFTVREHFGSSTRFGSTWNYVAFINHYNGAICWAMTVNLNRPISKYFTNIKKERRRKEVLTEGKVTVVSLESLRSHEVPQAQLPVN